VSLKVNPNVNKFYAEIKFRCTLFHLG